MELPHERERVPVEVELDGDGRPLGAVATTIVAATPARVWSRIFDVDGYPGIVPMIHKVKREGERVHVQLRFRISLFSVGFEFTADVRYEDERWLELRWAAGEPRGLRIRFDLDDDAAGSRLRAGIWFDVFSLGWLAKYFLKHHPEIQYGIFPGSALVMVESIRKAAEAG
jgi:hypothetical protein